jgi:5-methylcytosine-specific restriction endonuclease McrA
MTIQDIEYYSSSEWRQIRRQVLERDNRTCKKCGQKSHLHVHHIIPRRKGGLNTLDNLISLCHKCHKPEEFKDYVGIVKIMIRIRKDIHKGLIDLAKYGDSMSDVIDMLLESYHENKGKSTSTSTKEKGIKK